MSGAYMSLCDCCAEKIGKLRDIEESSMKFMGRCSSCWQYSQLSQYEVGKTHAELDRLRRMQAAGDKSKKVYGERGRAERRGEHGQKV